MSGVGVKSKETPLQGVPRPVHVSVVRSALGRAGDVPVDDTDDVLVGSCDAGLATGEIAELIRQNDADAVGRFLDAAVSHPRWVGLVVRELALRDQLPVAAFMLPRADEVARVPEAVHSRKESHVRSKRASGALDESAIHDAGDVNQLGRVGDRTDLWTRGRCVVAASEAAERADYEQAEKEQDAPSAKRQIHGFEPPETVGEWASSAKITVPA